MGIGVALGVIAAKPTSGLSLIGGAAAGAAAEALSASSSTKGLKKTDEDVAHIGRQLNTGHAAVGALTWDFETEAVTQRFKDLGGTDPQSLKVSNVTPESR